MSQGVREADLHQQVVFLATCRGTLKFGSLLRSAADTRDLLLTQLLGCDCTVAQLLQLRQCCCSTAPRSPLRGGARAKLPCKQSTTQCSFVGGVKPCMSVSTPHITSSQHQCFAQHKTVTQRGRVRTVSQQVHTLFACSSSCCPCANCAVQSK